METLLITGAEGMIANHFATLYDGKYNIRFLSRRPVGPNVYHWDPDLGFIDPVALEGVDHVLHLAGASIFGHRWTARYRNEIISSRADSITLLASALMTQNIRLKTFVSASATGYYGLENSEDIKYETSKPGKGFIPKVCQAWEEEAEFLHVENLAERVVILRLGLVFSHYFGALPFMAMGCRYGIASVLGSGKQYVPWIHVNDLCRMFHFVIQNPFAKGVYNAVAPDLVTYRDVVSTLAYLYTGKSCALWVPSPFIRLMYGDASNLILNGNKVSSQKIQDEGFEFLHPELEEALSSIYEL
ncbi:TIGR01777 family oxidoreductase [Porphyromonas sp.]|uniref:TIGR01777 family oxidoreductase n=1 Tax=Porphyromonas sp. TaxID=1924944 RepID=UPI0026DDC1CD|nr:TIGR01777 family oxidoreductase [Porphyromonas sp.]MDO4695553.1 TIGR01777 family oxidoreductase [Porphyromonas sp.]MDO4771360.1 TIGR01777 family oxidoreductase [Porphyromonas sp.]